MKNKEKYAKEIEEMKLPLAKKLENQYGVLICVVPCVQLILMRMNIKRAQITEENGQSPNT